MREESIGPWTTWTVLGAAIVLGGLAAAAVGCGRDAAAAPAPVPSAPAHHAPAPSVSADRPLTSAAPEVGSPTLAIARLIVTTGIDRREPVPNPDLRTNAPVVAFLEVANPRPSAAQIVLTFERPGQDAVGNVPLVIPAGTRRWRTWGESRRIRTPGEWSAVVRTEDGEELGRTRFTVRSPPGSPAASATGQP
ncbi:MAG: DUF2914 domain-containing protein [Polyangiaceae bacterium]|nr:DUF2914 domain-containing protein [Polyangiaceae bacterium]